MTNTNSNFTIRPLAECRNRYGQLRLELEVIVDWADVDSIDEAVNLSLKLPQVKQLNPGSDYTEQYFDIEVTANSISIIFRKE